MGFLDNLPFAKKKEDFSLPPANDPFAGQTFSAPQDPLAVQPSQSFGSPPAYPTSPYPSGSPMYPSPGYPSPGIEQFSQTSQSRDMELIRAKMDAIQATLESLNQRFSAIERYINESARRRW